MKVDQTPFLAVNMICVSALSPDKPQPQIGSPEAIVQA